MQAPSPRTQKNQTPPTAKKPPRKTPSPPNPPETTPTAARRPCPRDHHAKASLRSPSPCSPPRDQRRTPYNRAPKQPTPQPEHPIRQTRMQPAPRTAGTLCGRHPARQARRTAAARPSNRRPSLSTPYGGRAYGGRACGGTPCGGHPVRHAPMRREPWQQGSALPCARERRDEASPRGPSPCRPPRDRRRTPYNRASKQPTPQPEHPTRRTRMQRARRVVGTPYGGHAVRHAGPCEGMP